MSDQERLTICRVFSFSPCNDANHSAIWLMSTGNEMPCILDLQFSQQLQECKWVTFSTCGSIAIDHFLRLVLVVRKSSYQCFCDLQLGFHSGPVLCSLCFLWSLLFAPMCYFTENLPHAKLCTSNLWLAIARCSTWLLFPTGELFLVSRF